MSDKLKLLDLFCCGGGAGMGWHMAGFDVTGVDINPQPKYPFKFIQSDALQMDLSGFDVIWASPPCQAFTRAKKLQGNIHPELIEPVRKMLIASGKPYCIENVMGAPLIDPVMLCGTMFGLTTYRHRIFEANFEIQQPPHPEHKNKNAKMGRAPKDDEFIQVVGHFSDVPAGKKAMGIDGLGQKELAQAIPPAYSKYIAECYLKSIGVANAI